MSYLIIPFSLLLILGLEWLRKGHGGKLGQAIRNSDHWAWQEAVKDKEQELAELKAAEPRK